MHRNRHRIRAGLAAAVAVVMVLLFGAVPAHAAYSKSDLDVLDGYVDIDPDRNCPTIGELDAYLSQGFCRIEDSHDGTGFRQENNANALKIEFYLNGTNTLVGKVEFHPYTRLLWAYDLRSDGNGFWVDACLLQDTGRCTNLTPRYHAANPPAKPELAFPEGSSIRIQVWPTKTETDPAKRLAVGNAVV